MACWVSRSYSNSCRLRLNSTNRPGQWCPAWRSCWSPSGSGWYQCSPETNRTLKWHRSGHWPTAGGCWERDHFAGCLVGPCCSRFSGDRSLWAERCRCELCACLEWPSTWSCRWGRLRLRAPRMLCWGEARSRWVSTSCRYGQCRACWLLGIAWGWDFVLVAFYSLVAESAFRCSSLRWLICWHLLGMIIFFKGYLLLWCWVSIFITSHLICPKHV